MGSSVCTLKREFNDAEALMSPLFEPTESKRDFQGTSEDPIMKEEPVATKNTEDMASYELKIKKNIIDAESSMAASCVPIKAGSVFRNESGKNMGEEGSQASKITEVLVSHASFLVKEEPIDCEETWQDSIKLEPACPLSVNTQRGESDNSSEDGVNVKILDIVKEEELSEELSSPCSMKEEKHGISEEGNSQPHLDFSALPRSSQFVSSTECPSEMNGTDIQKHFERFSCSSSSKAVRLSGFGCQNVLPAASCSNNNPTVGQEKTADTYLWKKHAEQQVAQERQKQQSGHFGERSNINLEEMHFQREMLQPGSLRSSRGEGFFKCGHCGKDIKRKYDLAKHMRIHTGDRPYKCSKCGKSFTQNGHLTRHMRGHTGERPYKCSQCGRSFSHSDSLTSHMRTHTGDRPYKCSQCGKAFVQSSHLTNHMRTHTGYRPYKCPQCWESFAQSSSLTHHIRKHTGDRPYNCSLCAKSYVSTSSLTIHMRIHTGDRPYKCSQCEKSFSEKTILTKHMRTHTGDRPYECSQCGKSFTQNSSLTSHLRIHSGDRPYKCSQCGRSFTVSSSLAKHMRTHW